MLTVEESKMSDETKRTRSLNSSDDTVLSRRNVLLAGTSLVTATAISAVDGTQVAQAQQPPQASVSSGRKANILVIMADDIGWFNPSIYHRGDMAGVQSPFRSVRARRRERHAFRDQPTIVLHRAGPGPGRPLAGDVQGLSAEAEAFELQHRCDRAEAGRAASRRRLA